MPKWLLWYAGPPGGRGSHWGVFVFAMPPHCSVHTDIPQQTAFDPRSFNHPGGGARGPAALLLSARSMESGTVREISSNNHGHTSLPSLCFHSHWQMLPAQEHLCLIFCPFLSQSTNFGLKAHHSHYTLPQGVLLPLPPSSLLSLSPEPPLTFIPVFCPFL